MPGVHCTNVQLHYICSSYCYTGKCLHSMGYHKLIYVVLKVFTDTNWFILRPINELLSYGTRRISHIFLSGDTACRESDKKLTDEYITSCTIDALYHQQNIQLLQASIKISIKHSAGWSKKTPYFVCNCIYKMGYNFGPNWHRYLLKTCC